jgi:hypothetical protein
MSVRAFDAKTGRDRLLGMPYGHRATRGGWFRYFQPRRNQVPERYLLAGAGGRGFGLLDGTMFIRTCWWTDGRAAGQMLVVRGARTWGVRCCPPHQTPTIHVKRTPYELSAWAFEQDTKPSEEDRGWTVKDIPVAVRAMVLAGETLFIAGPPDRLDAKGGLLWAYSAADGRRLAQMRLDSPPVWDGMAAVDGRLYISAKSRKLICLGRKARR